MKPGIEIWTRLLNSVQISSDGNTATIGGGVKAKEVIDALWAANKQSIIARNQFLSSLRGP